MKHLRRLTVSFAIASSLAIAGPSAATAALPEFVNGSPHGLESILKTTKLETVGKTAVTCKHGSNRGEVTGTKTVAIEIFLAECKIPGALCTSPGAEPGDIITPTLLGSLGYIQAVKKMVGLDLSSPTAPIAVFFCGPASFVVQGSVIGKITPVNKLLSAGEHFTLKFSQKEGKQKPANFEGEPTDVLQTSINGKPFEESGLATTDEVFFAAPTEIKA